MPQPILLSKSQYVSVAHRYWDERYSADENARVYGTQASREGLGSNMKIELGRFNATETEIEALLAQAKKLLDHRRLFTEVDEFKTKASTLERVALFLAREVQGIEQLRLEENDRLACLIGNEMKEISLAMKVMNLELTLTGEIPESGLLVDRDEVTQAVIEEYKNNRGAEGLEPSRWAERLFAQLSARMPLRKLRIDLGRQRYILVKSEG